MKTMPIAILAVFCLFYAAVCQEIMDCSMSNSRASCPKESILKYIDAQLWTKRTQIDLQKIKIYNMERVQENHTSELIKYEKWLRECKGLQEILLQNSEIHKQELSRQQNQIDNLTNLLEARMDKWDQNFLEDKINNLTKLLDVQGDRYNHLQEQLIQRLESQEQELSTQRAQIDNLTISVARQREIIYSVVIPEKISICEKETGTLSCADGKIKIRKAMYGRLNRSTCARHRISNTNCNIKGAISKVQTRCDGKQHCTLPATNDFFMGDPCRGIFKYLDVEWICEVE